MLFCVVGRFFSYLLINGKGSKLFMSYYPWKIKFVYLKKEIYIYNELILKYILVLVVY